MVNPSVGMIGDSPTVVGTGFVDGATVALDGVPARTIFVTSIFLRLNTPAHPVGVVDVTVTNPDGQSATLARGWKYEVVTLTASPAVAAPGAPLTATWTAPVTRGVFLDWISLFKVSDSDTNYDEDRWQYAKGATGTMTTTAPPRPGVYEFRYMSVDDYAMARSSPITVR